MSNPFWFLFIVNVQYEYNWIRLRQLTYLVRSQKWIKIGTPLPGISALKSVSGGPFFGHLLIWPDAGARRRTLAPGGPEERNRCFAQKKNPEQNEFFFMSYYSAETPKEGAISEKLSDPYQNNNSEILSKISLLLFW